MLRAVNPPADDASTSPADEAAGVVVPPDDTHPVAPPDVALAGPPRAPRPSNGFFITYFAIGVALLLAGTVAVVVLAIRAYAPPANETPLASGRTASATPGRTSDGPTTYPTTYPTTPPPSTGPNGTALGPQRVTMGKALSVTGEDGAKFQVTVRAGKFRKTGCDPYAVKPKNGGYLPTEVKVKVLQGVPDVSEYDFRFQEPDGTWLDTVGGSGCETNTGGLFRRLVAGRTYTTTVIFDVPKAMRGDIVFVWPLRDVAGSWKVG
jgi:hypothetical protein